MEVDACEKIVHKLLQEKKFRNIQVRCEKWDGNPQLRTARGFFTADPHSDTESNLNAAIVLLPERIHGGESEIRELLTHEFIHAYDHFELRKDLTLCPELACSEIRAAREAECAGFSTNFLVSFACRRLGSNTEYCDRIKKTCVYRVARRSTRSVFTEDEATACVENMFETCYRDVRGSFSEATAPE